MDQTAPLRIVTFHNLPPAFQMVQQWAVNLHPSLLPAYRRPNPLRSIYEGEPLAGATLHWVDDDFDTGRILCQKSIDLPDTLIMEWFGSRWTSMVVATLAEGVQRAIAGEPGDVQDEASASKGTRFTEQEYWLSWELPGRRLHQQCFALNVGGEHGKGARIAGADYAIMHVTPLSDGSTGHAPGSLIAQAASGMTVACADGAVWVAATLLASDGA